MLKTKKHKIKWSHVRLMDNTKKMDSYNREAPRYAGVTECYLYTTEQEYLKGIPEPIAIGRAVCHRDDNFSYDSGRRISLQRVLKRSSIPKEERANIWEAYRNMTTKPRW